MNSKLRFLTLTVAALGFVTAGGSYGAPLDESLRTFRKMEATIEGGVTFNRYNVALNEIKLELKLMQDRNPAPAPKVKEHYEVATKLYSEARDLWQLTLGRFGSHFIEKGSALEKEYLTRYPDLEKDQFKGGAMSPVGLEISRVLPVLWREARNHIDAARDEMMEDEKRQSPHSPSGPDAGVAKTKTVKKP